MEQFIYNYFPHGYCLAWDWRLIIASVTSDQLIALSYFAISTVCIYAYNKDKVELCMTRDNILLWGCFIVSCGITHQWSIFTVFAPVYIADTVIKWFTGIVSAYTAYLVFFSILRAVQKEEAEKTNP